MKNQFVRDERPKSENDYSVLKLATRRIVKGCGGLEAASLVTRVGHSELARYYDPEEKLFMPVDVLADLEAIAGAPIVTQTLAQMLGYALVPLAPQEEVDVHLHWPALLAQLGEETATALRQVGSALSETGTLTARSINNYQLAAHLNNLIQAAMRLKASISQREERGTQARRTPPPAHGPLPLRKQS